MGENSSHEKGLLRVIVFATSLSFGCLGAIILSMKNFFTGNARFEFSYKTPLGFIAGWVLGWAFWKLIRRWMARGQNACSSCDDIGSRRDP